MLFCVQENAGLFETSLHCVPQLLGIHILRFPPEPRRVHCLGVTEVADGLMEGMLFLFGVPSGLTVGAG